MVTAELVILLFISMWLKSRDKGPDSSSEERMSHEETLASIEEENISPTLDQVAVVDTEIDAEN